MQEKDLQKTRQKLTLQFVGVVFLIALFLEVMFFSFRFFNQLSYSRNSFITTTNNILLNLTQREKFENVINPQIVELFDRSFMEKRGPRGIDENLVSYLIVNSKNEIIRKSLKEEVEVETLFFGEGEGFFRKNQTFVRREKVGESTVYLYKKVGYSVENYLSDIFVFTSFLFLFSVGFYMIGLQFVGKTLKPVEDNLKDMKDFIHNAGHELKTPLAVMRGNLQIIQAEKNFDADLLKDSIKEVDRMNSLIEGLRELSEVGKHSEKQNLALATEVALIVKEYSSLAADKDIEIINEISGSFVVSANKQELSMLLGNILQNAIKYNKKGGKVILKLTKNILSVTDTGKGIPKEEQDKIWERFFQGSTARSGEGFGIGLSLVKKIANNHGWQLKVDSEESKGTTFQILF